MKLKDFKRKMQKGIFSSAEAHVVAFVSDPKIINLQLHHWKKSGEIVQLKRGVFVFADYRPTSLEIAKSLCEPCYFSLEYVLGLQGIISEAVFSYTLVTTKKTRKFETQYGNFIYQTIKKDAFTGYDKGTLLAEPEKALVDYFYLNTSRLEFGSAFWEEARLNASFLNFKKVFSYAGLFKSKKLIKLLSDFQKYAKTDQYH